MATYGLTDEGFFAKTETVCLEEMQERFRQAFGESIDLSDATIEGQLCAILAEREALLWELAEQTYNSRNPDGATGRPLEVLCLTTGTFREPASQSVVTLTLCGDDTTLVSAGSQVETSTTGAAFIIDEDATIVAVAAWANSTAYVADDRVTNGGNVYHCVTAGTSAAGPATGPSGTGAAISDGTVVWSYAGEGEGAIDVVARSVEFDAVPAAANELTEIATPISGWTTARNLEAATLGNAYTSDESLRLLRQAELSAQGSSPLPALRAELLRADEDIVAVTVFQNVNDTTDADGVPPHAVEVLVRGGDDQTIFDTIFNGVAAGIKTHGTETGTSTDVEGTDHTVKFSRPDEVAIYIELDVVADEELFPDNGADQIAEAIVAWGNALATGRNAVASAIASRAFAVAGVLDTPSCLIDDAPGPTLSATIPISLRQLATYDVARITVNVTFETP